jgi:hypothetical protein
LRHLRGELSAELLAVHLLDVLEGAVVIVIGDGLAVDTRGKRRLGRVGAAAEHPAHPHVDEDEAEDERRDDDDEHPLEVMKTVAHYFEHENYLSGAIGIEVADVAEKAAQFTYSRAERQLL